MSKPIIPDPSPKHNSSEDLICPTCRATCSFHSGTRRVACIGCGWAATLTPAQNADLLNAILGITELPIPAFLANLHVSDDPAPPTGGAFRYPAALPAPHLLHERVAA